MSSPYEAFKQAQAMLEQNVEITAKAVREIPGVGTGLMGLNPDHVRLSPEYRAKKAAYDSAFAALRAFNGKYIKIFKAEIAAERARKYNHQQEN
jgi:hypothetical protein